MVPVLVRRFFGCVLIVGVCLIGARPAWAIPITIGEFGWQPPDDILGVGQSFSVGNFSSDYLPVGESFFGVFINLLLLDGTLWELDLGDVAPGGTVQTTEDLSSVGIQTASLQLRFPLSGQVTVDSLTGVDSFAWIYLSQDPVEPSTVPEPSSLVLMAVGAAGALIVARRRRAGTASSHK